jgi:hypothetical protein
MKAKGKGEHDMETNEDGNGTRWWAGNVDKDGISNQHRTVAPA